MPLLNDLPEFAYVAVQSIDRLHALPDQQLVDPDIHRGPLDLFALYGNEAYLPAHVRFADCLGIRSIIHLALNKRFGVNGRTWWPDMPIWRHQKFPRPQASIATTLGRSRPTKGKTCFRFSSSRITARPDVSAPYASNIFFARTH
jgi:hypothetical protein